MPGSRTTGSLFDVIIGSYDGTKVCELIGLFILHQLSQIVNVRNIGFYRTDGLAILENASGPTSERLTKKIIKLFHQHSLNITAETNLFQTNFLGVTFNLKSGKHWPYRKPNNQPLYVHYHSNHSTAIKTQLPSMFADRLSLLSCNREEFARTIPEYEEAMRRSGHSNELQYISPPGSYKRKSRKRNIVWFNPPFREHLKTNIGKVFFLQLLAKHFPTHHCLHKIYNNANVKVSYSCMPNIAAIMSRHNKVLLA